MSGLVDLFISFSTLGGQQQQTFPSLEPHFSSSKVLPLVPKQIQNSKILVVLLSGAIEAFFHTVLETWKDFVSKQASRRDGNTS